MFRTALSLCLLLALPATVPAARVAATRMTANLARRGNASSGPHKCTVAWEYRDQVAVASFGVGNCKTECLLTGNYNVKNVFPRAFTVQQRNKNCVCKGPEDNVLLKFPGLCGNDKSARERCWNDYKVLSSDTWERQFGKETPEIHHHPRKCTETHRNFNYGQIECSAEGQNQCEGNPDCEEFTLPSIFEGRDASIIGHIAKLAKALANGEISKRDIDRDMRDLIDALPEKEQNFYALVSGSPERGSGDVITVADLRAAYDEKLEGTGLSVDHLLKVAGFDTTSEIGLSRELTADDFDRFLKPDCN